MSATVVDALVVTFGLDASEYTKNRKKTEEDFDRTKEKATKTAKDIEASGKRASSFFSNLRGEVLALFAVFTAGKGLIDFTRDVVDGDAAMGRFAKTIDDSIEDLSAWRNMAELTGGSADGMAQSMQGLVDQYQQFTITGESSVIPYFRALQISMVDATGKMRPVSQILLDVADRFKGMDPARAATFGRAMGFDQGTINLLLLGRKAVQGMLDEQKKLGIVTKENAKAATEMQLAWGEAKQASTSAGRAMLLILAPAIIAVSKAITWVAEFLIAHKAILVGVFTALTIAVLALSTAMIVSFFGAAVTAMTTGFGLITAGLVDLSVWIGAMIETALPALAEAFLALGLAIEATPIGWIITGIAALAAIAYALGFNIEDLKAIFEGLGEGLNETVGPALDALADIFGSLGRALGLLNGPLDTTDQKLKAIKDTAKLVGEALGYAIDTIGWILMPGQMLSSALSRQAGVNPDGSAASPTGGGSGPPAPFVAGGGDFRASGGGGSPAGGGARSGGGAAPSGGLTTLQTSSGQQYQVNSQFASNFDGFVKELESRGYKISSIGGYNARNIAGTGTPSFHAQGAAIDINPGANPVGPANTNNLPADIAAIAAKHGLGWGGNWKSKKDPMHFSIAQSEGGSVPLRHGYLPRFSTAQAKGGNTKIIHATTTIGKVDVHTKATDAKGIAGDIGHELHEHAQAAQANYGAG